MSGSDSAGLAGVDSDTVRKTLPLCVTTSGLMWRLSGADRDAGCAAGGGLAEEAQGHGLNYNICN
jgi:hypothetical protein